MAHTLQALDAMTFENLHQFESETVHIAREIIASKELSTAEKQAAADQLKRVADEINLHVASLRRQQPAQPAEHDPTILNDWLKSFQGRG